MKSIFNVAIVVLNWNGKDPVQKCLDSIKDQGGKIIVVENGSVDGSLELIKEKYPFVELVVNPKNMGFAGGVNQGINIAIRERYDFVALLNNDAVADQSWLEQLVFYMNDHPDVGIATCKLITENKQNLDSTGENFSVWGLPFPRGRGEKVTNKYDNQTDIFGASGGASIYRVDMFKDIGLFDEDFFAYYEDVDISFRAQLKGWKVSYVPESKAYHQIGGTSGKIKGFTVYHGAKNRLLLFYKDVPRKYFWVIGRRFILANLLFLARAISRGQGWFAIKGYAKGLVLIPRKHKERKLIQSTKKVTDEYIWSIITHDLPPGSNALNHLRNVYWRLIGKSNGQNSN